MTVDSFFARSLAKIAAGLLLCVVLAFCDASFNGKILSKVAAVPRGRGTIRTGAAEAAAGQTAVAGTTAARFTDTERIAEIERAGVYFPGLSLTESGLREKAGDYAGAAVAAYKELSWAYSYGSVGREQVEEGLQNAIALFSDASHVPAAARDSALTALKGCMAFAREDWALAEELLSGVLTAAEEPDSFLRWMLLVCALETGSNDSRGNSQAERSAYGSIRARYMLFPEYWYRGARAFSGRDEREAAAVFAEQCINANPRGPFAGSSRAILEGYYGLSSNGKENAGLLTKNEIEGLVISSVSNNDPVILEGLFPLMALPENPYTLYAMGALKALSSVPEFRAFFTEGARKSPGRLGERLNYIARG